MFLMQSIKRCYSFWPVAAVMMLRYARTESALRNFHRKFDNNSFPRLGLA
jgi:hypothetical protein